MNKCLYFHFYRQFNAPLLNKSQTILTDSNILNCRVHLYLLNNPIFFIICPTYYNVFLLFKLWHKHPHKSLHHITSFPCFLCFLFCAVCPNLVQPHLLMDFPVFLSFSLHSSFSVLELIAGCGAEQGCCCFSHQTLDTGSVYVWGEDGPDDFQTTPLSTNYRRQEMSRAALDLISRNVLRAIVKCSYSQATVIYTLFL